MTTRFCYSTLRRPYDPLCCAVEAQPITSATLSTLSSLPCFVNNSRGATSQALLLSNCYLRQQEQRQRTVEQKVSTLLGNREAIETTFQRQLEVEAETRYNPYRPRYPEFIPPSVTELEMRTRNVGVPIPTMTIANCKGVQFVTK
jgi:hypothetical protein